MLGLNKLPWELRDRIYELCLVRDVIIVAPTALEAHQDISRSTWQDIRHISPIGGEIFTKSYHLHATNDETPYLSLFCTIHQVFAGCWPIFYKQNMFDFSNAETSFTATSMCLAFLNDRPQQVLQHTRRMHLIFGNLLCHRFGWSIPPAPWSKNSTVLSLHRLILSVSETFPDSGIHRSTLYPDKVGPKPWVPEICRITNLRDLEVDVTSNCKRLAGLDLSNDLRARMLVNGSG